MLSRRELLARTAWVWLMGLASVLASEACCGHDRRSVDGPAALAPNRPHLRPKARRIVHLFMNGGPSQVDTFDPKPAGQVSWQAAAGLDLRTERKTGACLAIPFKSNATGSRD